MIPLNWASSGTCSSVQEKRLSEYQTVESLELEVAIVAIHSLAEDMEMEKLHHLRDDDVSGIHDRVPKEFFSKDGL